jgi:predicted house-cleaning noncanonical NTP pyrophosphatase (MazG superfamily)
MVKRYDKLVRDKVPENIRKHGGKPHCRILSGKELFGAAKKKVLEEAKELIRARRREDIINEIVDIEEVIDVLMAELGITRLELFTRRREKNLQKGRFEKRIF